MSGWVFFIVFNSEWLIKPRLQRHSDQSVDFEMSSGLLRRTWTKVIWVTNEFDWDYVKSGIVECKMRWGGGGGGGGRGGGYLYNEFLPRFKADLVIFLIISYFMWYKGLIWMSVHGADQRHLGLWLGLVPVLVKYSAVSLKRGQFPPNLTSL